MPIDTKTYITPTLRWGLYVKDHPGAPEPAFGLVSPADAGVPDTFCHDECGNPISEFVRCTIFYPDGSVAATGFKEVPAQELVAGKPKDYVRNAENYVKLCTMALGRALKRAGYPDRTTDLRAFLLYEQRNAEIEIIRSGGRPAELTTGKPEAEAAVDQTVTDAAVATPDTDHPEHDEDVEDAEVVADTDSRPVAAPEPVPESPGPPEPAEAHSEPQEAPQRYPDMLRKIANTLSVDGQQQLLDWLKEQGITPQVAHDRQTALKRAVAQAAAIAGTEQAEANAAAAQA